MCKVIASNAVTAPFNEVAEVLMPEIPIMDTKAKEILKMASKIQENQTEEEQLTINLHKKIETSVPNEQPLIIGKTLHSLIICDADDKIPLSIDKRIINKAMRAEKVDENGRMKLVIFWQ